MASSENRNRASILKKRYEYFASVRAGLKRDYTSMEKVFNDVIYRSLKSYEEE